jgi:hypothetical protein
MGSSSPVFPSVRVIISVPALPELALTLPDTSSPDAPNKDDFKKFLLSNLVMISVVIYLPINIFLP